MATDLLISCDPWENRVALLEDGVLSEIYFEREEKVIGSIFKGKVQNVLPGMGASFVDIGLGRNAFLYVDDINKTPLNIGDVEITQGRSGWTISEKVNRGDDVLVQIVKEPRGLKGARISTNISLPGRYLILMPTGRYSGVSRKIDSSDERNRLKAIMKRIRPEGMATVVRTAAAGISEAELIADLGVLIRMWHGILETYKRAPAPSLLHKDMNLVYKAARDFITSDVEHVYIDDAEEYEKVRDFMRLLGPQYLDRIHHYNAGRSLFRDFKIDEEMQKLLRPKVNLPSGGSIVIETTEALTVIDVNSGKFTGGRNLEDTIVKTNIEAAAEIARQVRLRDIGGIIVCDFIDMNTEANRTKVLTTLEAGLRRDRTRTTIQSFSALGLLEFTRKRVGKDLSGQLRAACPTCHGIGSVLSPDTVAIDTFRRIRIEAPRHLTHTNGHGTHGGSATNGATPALEDGAVAVVVAAEALPSAQALGSAGVFIEAAPTVGAQVEYWYEEELQALSRSIGAPIGVRVDQRVHPERPRIGYGAPPPVDPSADVRDIRVGDEFEVEIIAGRLPTPTSALAVVGGRLIEVENAANAAGQRIRVKILDIDGDDILAEPRAPVGPVADLGRKRRRRGGRGRTKPLTAAEQTEELRELAEEAARGQGGRTATIGISSQVEADFEDASVKAGATEKKVVEMASASLDAATAAATPGAAPFAGDESDVGRRRRRRRRRRGGRQQEGDVAALGQAPAQDAAFVEGDVEDDESEDEVEGVAATGEAGDQTATGVPGEERPGRRRRRRRRRGRGGRPFEALPGTPGAVPDRHIFRVGVDGAAEPTGETAPQEPVRALAQVDTRRRDVALEPPPPHLTAPEEDVKRTKPSRRRPAAAERGGQLETKPLRALAAGKPGVEDHDAEDAPTRRRRAARAKAEEAAVQVVSPVLFEIPEPLAKAVPAKRGRKPAAAAIEPAAKGPAPATPRRGRPPKVVAAEAVPVATVAAAAKKPASRRKAAAETPVPKRAAAANKTAAVKPAAAKKSTAKVPAAAKKRTVAAPARKAAASTAKKSPTRKKS